MKALVVSRDARFAADLAGKLSGQGFDVQTGDDSVTALAHCHEVDVLYLDLVLSDSDGFEVCRAIRAVSGVPVIMMGSRDDELDRVLGLKLGADDYVIRPYSVRELAARTEAAVRRARNHWEAFNPERSPDPVRKIGDIRVDLRRRCVAMNGRDVHLTRKEFDILALLISDPERVFTREHIMTDVWGHDGAGDTRTLGVHVSGLRKKLGNPMLIETVRGVGFRLALVNGPPEERERAS